MGFAELRHQKIVVTGASGGIGRAIALECAAAGADLMICYRRSADAAEGVADEIRKLGRAAIVVQADVSDPADRRKLEEAAFRDGQVHALVNNAGADLLTGEARNLPFSEKLRRLLDVDVTGTVELSRTFGRRFQEQGHGCILTIGWDQSDRGMEGDSGELFAAAKNAVMGFTRSLSLSLAPTVRVNCIAPGWIRTAWGESAGDYWQQRVVSETPLRRWGEPRDIANTARFLLSQEADYITGQVFNVNGGAVR
ncbi:MAG: SDR family oxidoreductase [Planctomycetaceae bacterium]|nr:SDR family oxidoreductase [Planctomycetaceae bacterium]